MMNTSEHTVTIPIVDYIAMKNAYDNVMANKVLDNLTLLQKTKNIHILNLHNSKELAKSVDVIAGSVTGTGPQSLTIRFNF